MSINRGFNYIFDDCGGCFLDIDESMLPFDIYRCSDGSEVDIDAFYCTIREDGIDNNAVYKADFISEIHDCFVVSEKTKEVFESFSLHKTRFVPVINKADGNTIGYVLICSNLLDDAVDYDASFGFWHEYTIKGKKIREFDPVKPALIFDAVKDEDIFKVRECQFRLFISDNVLKAIEQAGLNCYETVNVKLV